MGMKRAKISRTLWGIAAKGKRVKEDRIHVKVLEKKSVWDGYWIDIFFLTFFNVLRQPLQTFEQTFPRSSTTEKTNIIPIDTQGKVHCHPHLGWTYHERSRIR